MNGYLRQSTASQVRTIGPFLDSATFVDFENALSIANTDIKLKKNGAASGNKNSGGATADGTFGLYQLTWDVADTATVGELFVCVSVAGALPVFATYVVLEEAVYDQLYAAAAPGAATTAQATAIESDTQDLQARVPAALVSGRMDASVGAMAANVLTAAAITTGAFTAAKFAAGAFDAVWSVAARILTAGTNIVLAKGTGITGFTDLDAAGVRSAVGLASANLDTQLAAKPTAAQAADAVWDEAIAGHLGAGSTGAALNAAGAAGDPWTTPLPGAYGVGTAGHTLGTNLDATVSSRATPAQVATELATYDGPTNAELTARTLPTASYATAAGVSAVETDTQDIQARLPAALVSGRMNANVGAVNNTAVTGDGSAIPWGPA